MIADASLVMYDKAVIKADATVVELYRVEAALNSDDIEYGWPFGGSFSEEYINFAEDGVKPPKGGISEYEIADNYYIVYMGSNNAAPYDEFQEFYAGYGYQTYKQEEIDEIIADYAQQQGIEMWILEDETQPEVYILEKEWYSEYIESETLVLSNEDIDKLAIIGESLYMDFAYNMEYTSKYFSTWNIQETMSAGMGSFLCWTGILSDYNEGGWSGEKDSYGTEMHHGYKVKEENARAVIKDLFGFEYDLQKLGNGDILDYELGSFYKDGYVIVYMGNIGLEHFVTYQGMYKEDGYWKMEILIDNQDKIILFLSPWKNSFGYRIVGCDVEKWS